MNLTPPSGVVVQYLHEICLQYIIRDVNFNLWTARTADEGGAPQGVRRSRRLVLCRRSAEGDHHRAADRPGGGVAGENIEHERPLVILTRRRWKAQTAPSRLLATALTVPALTLRPSTTATCGYLGQVIIDGDAHAPSQPPRRWPPPPAVVAPI
jgi:hypothetical protein